MAKAPDRWHRWLTDVRFGGDPAVREHLLTEFLYPLRDKVLDKAKLQPDDTVLDVGVGDGLASADSLADLADASVDVVTTRSVLIYVKDKAAALREFHRVLRPGGRISVFEPINVLMQDPERFLGYDAAPIRPLVAKLRAVYESIQPPGDDPMLDFDERDLMRHAKQAGFDEIGLELRVTVNNSRRPVPCERALRTAGNPRLPTFGEVLDRALSGQEIAELTAYLKPLVECGGGRTRT